MEIRFKYDDLINRCEQLSSFESEGKLDAAGQSRYLEIHINEVDKLLVRQYIDQARNVLEERMERMISRAASSNDDFRWNIRSDARWKPNNTFQRHVSEAIVAYTMGEWLRDKLPERASFYESLFAASTEMAVKNVFKKQAPTYEE